MGAFLDFMGKMASPISSLIGGAASMISGAQDRKAQEKINQQNIDFQKQTNAENRAFQDSQLFKQYMFNQNMAYQAQDFQEKMYEKQRQDNSMKEMFKQAQEAGINPFALFDNQGYQGGSISGVPQASGVSPNAVPLQAPHAEMIAGVGERTFSMFSSLAQALSSLSQSGLNQAQKKSIMSLITPQINKLVAETENTELKNTYQELENSLKSYFGFSEHEKALKEMDEKINKLQKEALSLDKDISEKDWQIKMQPIREELLKAQKKLTNEQYLQLEKIVNHLDEDFQTMFTLRRAQSQQAKAGAAESFAKAQTENATRPFTVRLQGALARLNESDAAFKEESFQTRFNILLDDMEKNGISVGTMREALKKAQKENDAFWLKLILENAVNISNSGAKWADAVIPF